MKSLSLVNQMKAALKRNQSYSTIVALKYLRLSDSRRNCSSRFVDALLVKHAPLWECRHSAEARGVKWLYGVRWQYE